MNQASKGAGDDNQLDDPLGQLLSRLRDESKTFVIVVAAGLLLSIAVVLLVPRYYVASTLLLVSQPSSNGSSGAAAQLGALVGLPGLGTTKSPEEMYAALLRSRTIQDAIIGKFSLQGAYQATTLAETRSKLESRTQITADKKTSLIVVSVDDQSAEQAARMANAFVIELQKMLSKIAITEAQERRMFYEAQLSKAALDLKAAELTFRQLQAERGMVVSELLAEEQSRTSAELRARITEKEVQRDALGHFATARNPDVQRLDTEIEALKQALRKGEEGRGQGKVSGSGMDAVQAYRDMRVRATALEQLVRQAELAKLDEAREGPRLQQIDVATPPEKPTKPRRLFLAVVGGIASVALGAVAALARSRWRVRSVSP
ncbi:Wzz/FepE/Etk N-terminal domain-containing protein [Aquabacterium soli]|nr:Wzz/FepE/Etk N-terminal domain-containing protein [Aquabacterium soli]